MLENIMRAMRLSLAFLAAFLLLPSSLHAQTLHWNPEQSQRLIAWLDAAPQEGLKTFDAEANSVRDALARQDQARLDVVATAAALELLDAHRNGCCRTELRPGWKIPHDQTRPAATALADALGRNDIDGLFAQARPSHPFYNALRTALATETDKARRITLLANLDRWRWMPRSLGSRYLLVNAAGFEASLWQDGAEVGRWRVIVGKSKTPTPIFAATITGVTFNPWWEIPSSIVAESVGSLVRRHPSLARRRGYVVQDGRYRQRPGDNNALGRMKLVMPNPYTVYLHDTPSKSLFERDTRTFSHGCIRVGDALGLAGTLLSQRPGGWTRANTDAVLATNQTTTISLATPIPVYVTYFTAEPDAAGTMRYFPDVYGRDKAGILTPEANATCPV